MAYSSLHSIAKLSGSFAFGGLLAKEICFSKNEEGAGLLGLLQPTAAHALSLRWRPAPTAPRTRTFFALDESGRTTKVYPSELRLRSISSQFSSSSILAALGRGCLFTYLPLFEAHYEAIRRSEQEAEEAGKEWDYQDAPDFDYGVAASLWPAAAIATVKELAVGITRVLLSWLAVDYLDSRLAWKLVKDQMSSLRAKWRFPIYRRPLYIGRTFLRTSVIPVCAEFLVTTSIVVVRLAFKDLPSGERLKLLGQNMITRGLGQICALVAASAGAGIAGAVRPGILCIIASLGAGFAMDTFICTPAKELYMNKGQITGQTKLIIAGCGTAVLLCFLPWLHVPELLKGNLENKQLAVAY